MDRRHFLGLIAGSMVGLAGCSGGDEEEPEQEDTETPTTEEATQETNEETSEEPSGVEELFSDSNDNLGLKTAISETGSNIAYGLSNSDIHLYDDQGNGERLDITVNRSVSHLFVSEKQEQIVAAWMGSGVLGSLDFNANTNWSYSFPNLWDIDPTPNMNAVAAVTFPDGEAGSIGFATEEEVQWTKTLPDASGLSTAITDDQSHIAVGAGEYWDGSEYSGSPAVILYDRPGSELWNHETEIDVINVSISQSEEVVVAGIDSGRLLVLDFEENVVWDDAEAGGFISLSEDGSTIVSDQFGTIKAYTIEGQEKWQAEVGGLIADGVSVSEDGSRVLAVEQTAGNAYFIESGEVVWEETFDENPIRGDLSSDGSTWSIIEQDNDTENANFYAYRDNR